jgi:hypothetical protein
MTASPVGRGCDLRDVIQPFPTFSEVYVAGLKALRSAIIAERRPTGAGA